MIAAVNDSPDQNASSVQLGDFTHQAEAYRTARPHYPESLIDRLCTLCKVTPGDRVADIGAGTGIFTQQLAERGLQVTAVEPNATMRRCAQAHTNVQWVDGTFESTGLQRESQDWVAAAQAFHWADPPQALPEMQRILKPGGYFTVLWNNRLNNDSPLLAKTWAVIKEIVPDFEDNYRELDWAEVLPSTGHFANVAVMEDRHAIDMPTERFLNLWRSHNRLNLIAGPQRFGLIMERMKSILDDTGADCVTVPYLCRAWSARRCE